MKNQNEIIEELLNENLKGTIVCRVQMKYLNELLKVTPDELKNNVMSSIGEIQDNIERYKKHNEILKSFISNEKS